MAVPPVPGWVDEFKAFIAKGNVMDLAVGVIIGAAFGAIVNSLVKDIINPIIGLFLGGVDFSNIFISLNHQHYDTLDAATKAGAATVNIGVFINAVINFGIMAFVIFWMVKLVSRFRKPEAAPPAPGPTQTELLLAEIRDLLRK